MLGGRLRCIDSYLLVFDFVSRSYVTITLFTVAVSNVCFGSDPVLRDSQRLFVPGHLLC